MPKVEPAFLVTCEHASNRVPKSFEPLFRGERELLRSHRGWDPGARQIARSIARALDAPLVCGRCTRLLVDLNRSPGNPRVFSRITRRLAQTERCRLLARFHEPYWSRIRGMIHRQRGRRVVHVAVHTFAPSLDGRERAVDVGLLYDPARLSELRLCREWQLRLAAITVDLRIRRNSPYRGNTDGLPSALRRSFSARRYVGLELELSQGLYPETARRLARRLGGTLRLAARTRS